MAMSHLSLEQGGLTTEYGVLYWRHYCTKYTVLLYIVHYSTLLYGIVMYFVLYVGMLQVEHL